MGYTTKEATQQTVITEKARELFYRFGIRKVTMDEIAREARMSKKTLYQHFSSKEELVRAVIESVQEQLIPRIMQQMARATTVRKRFLALWGVLFEFPRFVSREMILDLKSEYPALWEDVDSRRQVAFAEIASLVEAGVKDGDIHPEIHPRVLQFVLRAVLNKVMVPEAMLKGGFSPADVLATVITLFKRGLFTEPLIDDAVENDR